MAKKKFDISSTLNKNKPAPLAGKVPLRKTAKDPEVIKSKVEEIHGEEPLPAPPPAEKPKAPVKEVRLVRMTIDTPENTHKRLKIKAIEHGISIRKYILRLIEKDLKSVKKMNKVRIYRNTDLLK